MRYTISKDKRKGHTSPLDGQKTYERTQVEERLQLFTPLNTNSFFCKTISTLRYLNLDKVNLSKNFVPLSDSSYSFKCRANFL